MLRFTVQSQLNDKGQTATNVMDTEATPQQPTDADLPKPTPQIPDRTLTPILIRIETRLVGLFHSLPWLLWVAALAALLVIVSP